MNYPYKLVAASDLVIAKHTSLCYECICAGIPIIFRDYTHNISGMTSRHFDYDCPSLFVNNYQDLLARVNSILDDEKYLSYEEVYKLQVMLNNGATDGKVHDRILDYISSV